MSETTEKKKLIRLVMRVNFDPDFTRWDKPEEWEETQERWRKSIQKPIRDEWELRGEDDVRFRTCNGRDIYKNGKDSPFENVLIEHYGMEITAEVFCLPENEPRLRHEMIEAIMARVGAIYDHLHGLHDILTQEWNKGWTKA